MWKRVAVFGVKKEVLYFKFNLGVKCSYLEGFELMYKK